MKIEKKRVVIVVIMVIMVELMGSIAIGGVVGDEGGKHYKRGQKYEVNGQWDLAAEQYAMALSERPGSIEYKLHLLRALSNASLMYMERGKKLGEERDYEGAYQAYRQAYSYDQTNEMAIAKMKEMLRKQGKGVEESDLPESEIEKVSERREQMKRVVLPDRKLKLYNFDFTDTRLDQVIKSLGENAGINIVFEDGISRTVETKKVNFSIKNVSAPKALEILFDAHRLDYSLVAPRTIMLYTEAQANKQRYENLMVKTLFIKNADLNEVRNVLQATIGTKQMVPLKDINALVVRDTAENIRMAEVVLATIDKSQSEIVLDVNLYEVSSSTLSQIGNQIAVPTDNGRGVNLGNIGGIGQNGLRGGSPGGFFGGPIGLALALPTSAVSLLQTKSDSKLIASTQVRAFEKESATVNIGQRVPVQTAVLPGGFGVVNPGQGQQPGQPTQGGGGNFFGGLGIPQFQYQDVGLNIQIQPQVFNEYVQMKVDVDLSGILGGPSQFNPIFTQRKMKGTARIKEGETGIVANVMRLDKRNSKSGVPFVSFVPLVGRFFSTPNETSDAVNVVITITPHVLRSPEKSDFDNMSIGPNGTATSFGAYESLEEIVIKADEEDYQANLQDTTPQTPVSSRSANFQNVATQQTGLQQPVNPNPEPPPVAANAGEQEQPAVNVMIRVLNPQVRVGQGGLIGVLLSSSGGLVTGASLSLRFNSSIVKVTSVRDGGLLSLVGAQAEFNSTDGGDVVTINITRPIGAQAVQASGQLALIYFQGVGQGSSEISISDIELRGSNGQPLGVSVTNGNIVVESAAQDNSEDEEDEEE
jgi:general secretion pathway protein D